MIINASIVLVVFALCVVVLIAFLVRYQIIEYDFYQARAISQQTLDTTINANRGVITDCNGVELAISSTVKTVYLAPKNIKNEEQAREIAKNLSEILDVDYDTVYAKTQKNNYYEVVKRKVENDIADKIREFVKESKVSGVHLIDDTKRRYPYNNLASHIIGFVGTDNTGLEGIELTYNEYLTGTNGKLITAKNNAGTELPIEYETYVPAQDGATVALTIDNTVQYYLEKHIDQARKEKNCYDGAAGIVMNVKTGAILGMTSKPDYDLNQYQIVTDSVLAEQLTNYTPAEEGDLTVAEKESELVNLMRRNKLIVDTYEPGSTFKILTASMAVEENLVNANSSFYCPGYKMVAGRRIACWRHAGHGTQSFSESLQNSCNPAFMSIGELVTNTTFKNYFENFGLTERTGVDLAGEATGIFHAPGSFNIVELATASFGQRFKVTPIQMITAVSAVANGGYLVTPHVVKEIYTTSEDGKKTVIETVESGVKRQVISEQTSKEMCGILEKVVSVGSGRNAYVKGYRVAGKTGTSEKLASETTTGEEEYIASFIGFAPADDPQIAILVMLDEPSGGEYFGGMTAAPVASKILADVMPYLEIPAEYTPEELATLDASVPSVIGMQTDAAIEDIKTKGLKYKIVGGEGAVEHQMPKNGTLIPQGGTVVLYTNGKEPSATITVPDVVGMTVAASAKMINNYGLNAKLVGNESTKSTALIASQSPAAGTVVEAGTVVTLNYKNYDGVSN